MTIEVLNEPQETPEVFCQACGRRWDLEAIWYIVQSDPLGFTDEDTVHGIPVCPQCFHFCYGPEYLQRYLVP